ncbi:MULTISPECIES: universal stress protein [unclassified Colwellia]|uniref:universal stress protein n=1 Tax=unclassified Colwellia TaxID=196834 RepID=UPI0015F6DB4F|nr:MULTISPECIES: universal stress protein [unclassified Colwellia]MBA6233855.1 universal stress protein [Colwellia sp. MB02u-7]MBA6237329.1 universal stress protein [Colwellia sp. MB02u-11]MBA6300329.1 universal stress protein [Colwellia sp. MB3u-22]MBA6304661.1 universal stress protein [Colwellia sp. MB02u-14]MBA6310920.1 universal stress protein [Colwellia sp. MB3u-64]
MYKHILFATELTEDKSLVEAKVMALQKLTQAKLSVIHVIEPIPSAYYGGVYGVIPDINPIDNMSTTNALEERAKHALKPLTKRLNIQEQDLHIPIGHTSGEILSFAKKENVDLIITGSHGVHGLQLLLGSTANAVLHGANCDVLAVRHSD